MADHSNVNRPFALHHAPFWLATALCLAQASCGGPDPTSGGAPDPAREARDIATSHEALIAPTKVTISPGRVIADGVAIPAPVVLGSDPATLDWIHWGLSGTQANRKASSGAPL